MYQISFHDYDSRGAVIALPQMVEAVFEPGLKPPISPENHSNIVPITDCWQASATCDGFKATATSPRSWPGAWMIRASICRPSAIRSDMTIRTRSLPVIEEIRDALTLRFAPALHRPVRTFGAVGRGRLIPSFRSS